MRRLVSVLFILLLLLRSLMGSAVAADALPSLPSPTMHSMAQPAPASLPVSAMDGAEHAHHLPSDSAPQAIDNSTPNACSEAANAGCADHPSHLDCTACAWCHSAMLAPPALCAHKAHTASSPTAGTDTWFASVLAAPAIKPPIA